MSIFRKKEGKLGLLIISKFFQEFALQLEAIPVRSLDPPERAKGERGKAGQGIVTGQRAGAEAEKALSNEKVTGAFTLFM